MCITNETSKVLIAARGLSEGGPSTTDIVLVTSEDGMIERDILEKDILMKDFMKQDTTEMGISLK